MKQVLSNALSFLLVFTLICIFPNITLAKQTKAFTKIEPAIVDQFSKSANQIVIVEMLETIKNTEASRKYMSGLKQAVVNSVRSKNPAVKLKSELKHFNMMVLEVDKNSLEILENSKLVKRVYFNGFDDMMLESSLPYLGAQNFNGIETGGSGTAVAIIDTPIDYDNGHFGDCSVVGQQGCSVAVWENFTDENIEQVLSNTYHGINVGGIVHGVAPEAKLLGLNVFSYSSQQGRYVAQYHHLMEALEWVAEHAEEYNIVAANMSLGSEREDPEPCNDDGRYTIFKTLLESHNVVSVVSSGNEARLSIGSPSCVTNAYSIGASYDTDLQWVLSLYCADLGATSGQMVCFTNRTGNLDIMAPGANVTAGGIENLGGTSMSAPHVSGAIALLQAKKLADNSEVVKARNVMKELKLMSRPLIQDDYYYEQLNLNSQQSASFDYMFSFAEYSKETQEAQISKDTGLLKTITVAKLDADTSIGGAYLLMEVIHPQPEDIGVTLTSPAETEVSFSLQKGQFGFNGVIGKEYLPGMLDAFKGESMNGEWKLSLTDSGETDTDGYLISATLVIAKSDCTFGCGLKDCGDDGCGGSCGKCANGRYCNIWNRCTLNDDVCQGDSCDGAIELPFAEETVIDDNTISCSMFNKSSCGGGLSPERVYKIKLDKNTNFSADASGFDIIMYLKQDSCDGEEITCVKKGIDDGEGKIFSIDEKLEAGTYFLFVDGNDINDYAGDYHLVVNMCAPDCENRDCGDDGCGGSCGTCDGVCTEEGACCVPDCEDKVCGDDGCGGSCGECSEGEFCSDEYNCVETCEPDCVIEVPCEKDALECFESSVYKCAASGYDWDKLEDCDFGCADGVCLEEEVQTDGDNEIEIDSENGETEEGSSGGCANTENQNLQMLLILMALMFLRKRMLSFYNRSKI